MMRNRWGVEIKKGYHAWATWGNSRVPIDGTISRIDRTSDFARAYGAQVTLENSRGEYTIGADEISEVLPPMRVGRGGVVKANPAEIHIDIGSHNTKGRNVRAKNPSGKWDFYDFKIGSHFLSALVNGDTSGLSDDEESELDTWIESQNLPQPGHWSVTNDEDEFGRDEITGKRGAVTRVQWVFKRGANPTPRLTHSAGYRVNWDTFAGGTSAYNSEHNSYTARSPLGTLYVDPPSRRGGSWHVRFSNDLGRVEGGLWRDVGSARSAASAKKLAREWLESLAGESAMYSSLMGNPTPRLTRYDQPSQRERISERTGRATKTPSARLKNRRLKTHHFAPEGVWANPLTRVKLKSPAQRGGADPSPRLLKRRRVTAKAPPGFYANPVARNSDRYAVQRQKGSRWDTLELFDNREFALIFARAYANAHPTATIRVWDYGK